MLLLCFAMLSLVFAMLLSVFVMLCNVFGMLCYSYSIVWKQNLDFCPDFWDSDFLKGSFFYLLLDVRGHVWMIFGDVLHCFSYSFGGFFEFF